MPRNIRLCLIGCGYMALQNHAPSHRLLHENGAGVELAACCDLDLERAQRVQQVAGYSRVYTDPRAMLDTERPDAVCVAVPYVVMANAVTEVLNRGIPVLLEKPPADTLEELDAMIDLAQRKGVLTQVAFNRRFMATTLEFKRRLSTNGRPAALHGTMSRVRRLDEDFTTTAIHLIDNVRHVLGEDYAGAKLRYQQVQAGDATVTNYFLDGKTTGGTQVSLSICPAAGTSEEHFVASWDGGRTLGLHVPVPGREREDPGSVVEMTDQRIELLAGDQLSGSQEPFVLGGVFAENAAFIESVQQGRDSGMDLRAARQSLQIMLAMRARLSDWRG